MLVSRVLLLLGVSLPLFAQQGALPAQTELHQQLFLRNTDLLQAEQTALGENHPAGLDLLEGLLLPGVNQAIHGQWWKSAVFVAVEVGVLAINKKLNDDGEDLEREFETYARTHWNYERYWQDRVARGEYALEEPYMNPGEDGINGTGDEYEDGNGAGSHQLPGSYSYSEEMQRYWRIDDYGAWEYFTPTETQQYFEMIGKYAQFQRGWDDFQGDWSVTYFTSASHRYMALRSEANDKLIAADRWLGVLVANHVVSFVDVLLRRARENNGPERADAWWGADRWQVSTRQLPMEVAPVTTLQLSWSFRGL